MVEYVSVYRAALLDPDVFPWRYQRKCLTQVGQ